MHNSDGVYIDPEAYRNKGDETRCYIGGYQVDNDKKLFYTGKEIYEALKRGEYCFKVCKDTKENEVFLFWHQFESPTKEVLNSAFLSEKNHDYLNEQADRYGSPRDRDLSGIELLVVFMGNTVSPSDRIHRQLDKIDPTHQPDEYFNLIESLGELDY